MDGTSPTPGAGPEPDRFGCPACGNSVIYGTPSCGNCGNDLRPYFQATMPTTIASSGGPRWMLLLAMVLLLGGGLYVASEPRGVIDLLPDEVEDVPSVEFDADVRPPRPAAGYGAVRGLVRDLRKGGLPCAGTKIDSAGPPVESGSCQSRGTHVQINVYLDRASLRFAEGMFREWPFPTVHSDNWWVITTRPVAKQVAEITGGRFRKAQG